jgi:hypothetical protein
MGRKLKLFAPKEYWTTPKEEIDRVAGGCGPGGVGDYFVPDTIYGLSVKPACRIHDFCYAIGETIADKDSADRIFLNNMLRIIIEVTKWWILRKLRIWRAYTYYKAVKRFGGPAFWNGKNSSKEEREV